MRNTKTVVFVCNGIFVTDSMLILSTTTLYCIHVCDVLRDYYMTFSISALVLARDSHIKPDSEAGGLIWVEG